MSEHQFRNIYWLGYGDAMAEADRRRSWPKTTVIVVVVVVVVVVAALAFWAGRASMKSKVASAYEAGFDAGVAEETTNWEEWK